MRSRGEDKEQAVDAVQNAAVAREDPARIFDPSPAFEAGFKKITQLGGQVESCAQEGKVEPWCGAQGVSHGGAHGNAGNQAADASGPGLLGADGGPDLGAAEMAAGVKSPGVGREGGQQDQGDLRSGQEASQTEDKREIQNAEEQDLAVWKGIRSFVLVVDKQESNGHSQQSQADQGGTIPVQRCPDQTQGQKKTSDFPG